MDETMDDAGVCQNTKTQTQTIHQKKSKCYPPTSFASDRYNFSHGRRGIAIIIVNGVFKESGARCGSQRDKKKLQDMFSYLDFDVRTFTNVSSKNLCEVVDQVSKEDHSNNDCFAMAISSHGKTYMKDTNSGKEKGDSVMTVDGEVETRWILKKFGDRNCPSLSGKPRLFFIQACRGRYLDDGMEIPVAKPVPTMRYLTGSSIVMQDTVDSAREGANSCDYRTVSEHRNPQCQAPQKHRPSLTDVVVNPAPCYKDFLVMYATPPGYFAFRNEVKGSWFIGCLHKILTNHKKETDLLRMLTSVTRHMAQEMASVNKRDEYLDSKKQTPVLYSMLTKDIYLTPK